MKGLTYFAVLMALFAAMIFAQSSTSTPGDQSNSSKPSAQSQDTTTNTDTSNRTSRSTNGGWMHDRQSGNSVPDTTVRDQQPSTTSTTGASGQNNNEPSSSTMGTAGRTPAANEPSTPPPPDQQPDPSTKPSSPHPQAYLAPTPATRAVATHTPDPGTCMNPASLENAQSPAPRTPPCQ